MSLASVFVHVVENKGFILDNMGMNLTYRRIKFEFIFFILYVYVIVNDVRLTYSITFRVLKKERKTHYSLHKEKKNIFEKNHIFIKVANMDLKIS